jgi:hypothetical protein
MVPASYLLMRGFDSPFRRGFLDEREPFHQLGFHPGAERRRPRIDHIGPGIDKAALLL